MNHFKKLFLMTTIITAAHSSCSDDAEKKSEVPTNEKITKVSWGEADGKPVDRIEQRDELSLAIDVKFHKALKNVSVGFLIKDQFGQELTGESIFNSFRKGVEVHAGQLLRVRFRGANLLRGGQSYSVAIRINQVSRWDRSDNVVIYADELAAVFDVLTDNDEPMWFKFRMPFKVECQ